MKVKLLRAGLYGFVNREPGEYLELEQGLAEDVAARGDGVLVLPRVAQVIPAFGALNLPTIYEDEPEPAVEVEDEGQAEKPAEVPAVEVEDESK